jgi:hypothetical protein
MATDVGLPGATVTQTIHRLRSYLRFLGFSVLLRRAQALRVCASVEVAPQIARISAWI